jgi:hypothetical protein
MDLMTREEAQRVNELGKRVAEALGGTKREDVAFVTLVIAISVAREMGMPKEEFHECVDDMWGEPPLITSVPIT